MATNPFAHLIPQESRESASDGPALIFRAPDDPAKARADNLNATKSEIDIQNAPLDTAIKRQQLQDSSDDQRQRLLENVAKRRDEYNKSEVVSGYMAALPLYAAGLETQASPVGDNVLITSIAKVADPSTGVNVSESRNYEDASPFFQQKVQELRRQIDPDTGKFPDRIREQMRQELHNLMAQRNRAYLQERKRFRDLASSEGLDIQQIIGRHGGEAYRDVEAKFLKREPSVMGEDGELIQPGREDPKPREEVDINRIKLGDEMPDDPLAAIPTLSDEDTKFISQNARFMTPETVQTWFRERNLEITPENAKAVFDYYAGGGTQGIGVSYEEARKQRAAELERRGDVMDAVTKGSPIGGGVNPLFAQGMAFGLGDEAAGVGGFVGSALSGENPVEGYVDARDAERLRLEGIRQDYPVIGTGAEIAGSILTPFGAANVPGQGLKAAAAAGGRVGALSGALAGFGYGEGPNDSIGKALTGTVVGGAAGTALGAGGARLERYLNRPEAVAQRQAQQQVRNTIQAEGQQVADDAAAEGVRISRPYVDPTVRNKVTALEATRGGGRTIHEGLLGTADDIERRVGEIAGQGDVLNPEVMGETARGAGVRLIKQDKLKARNFYKRAEDLSRDITIVPVSAGRAIRENLEELSQSGEKGNAALIKFIKDTRDDLSKDGGITVQGLRDKRTELAGQIDQRGLTMSSADRRMNSILDAAADDIERALAPVPQAQDYFRKGDKIWRETRTYENDLIRKFIGPKDRPKSGEEVFRALQGAAGKGGDGKRLQQVIEAMNPSERANWVATLAGTLGKNQAGEFSPALLAKSLEKLNDRALRLAFGKDGVESLERLARIAETHKKVVGNLNLSRTSIPLNYKSWLYEKALGFGTAGGGGALAAGADAATAGAAAVVGVTAAGIGSAGRLGAQWLSARAVMNPDVSRWLATAPATTSAKAIDAHFNKLSSIAAKNPALAQELQSFQQFLMNAANDNTRRVTSAAASDEEQQ